MPKHSTKRNDWTPPEWDKKTISCGNCELYQPRGIFNQDDVCNLDGLPEVLTWRERGCNKGIQKQGEVKDRET